MTRVLTLPRDASTVPVRVLSSLLLFFPAGNDRAWGQFVCDASATETHPSAGQSALNPNPKQDGDLLSGFPVSAIEDQAARILASPAFQKSKRLSRFLSYAVTNTLQGNESSLKETVLGLDVFDRGSGFDPRVDPIVRIDARRLRARVSEYYESDGASDPIIIQFAPGSYVPRFVSSARMDAETSAGRGRTRTILREPKVLKKLGALNLLRQAQKHLETYTPEGVIKSASLFERATREDPTSPLAHVGLGLASIWKSILLCEASHTAMARARSSAQRVIELESTYADAHALLGFVQSAYDFDFHSANASLLLALRLNPASSRVRMARAMIFLAPMGMLREAIDEARCLEKQEPSPLRHKFGLGWLLYLAREYRAAAEKLEQVLQMNPHYLQARYSLGLAYEGLGEFARSEDLLMDPDIQVAYPLLPLRRKMLHHMRQGDRQRALEQVHRMEGQYSPGNIDPLAIAGAFAFLSDHERALQWLERAYEDRRYWLIYLNSDPAFDLLRGDARFQGLVAQMGLAGGNRDL